MVNGPIQRTMQYPTRSIDMRMPRRGRIASGFKGVVLCGTPWVPVLGDEEGWEEIAGTLAGATWLVIDLKLLTVTWATTPDPDDYMENIPVSLLDGLIVITYAPHFVTE